MEREGPGFLGDLAFLWVIIVLCIVVANVIDQQISGPVGLFLAIGAAMTIVFVGLLVYYRIFLDGRPLLGTASRTRFAILLFQLVFIGFIFGALFTPQDLITQLIVAGAVIALGTSLSYWWVYRRDTPEVGPVES